MNKLTKAIQLRQNNQFEEAEIIFKKLLAINSEDKHINYQYAWLLDKMGNEKYAIKYYNLAIKFGLDGKDLADCLLGLGSSYRIIKEYSKSVEVFKNALNQFPNNNEFKLFLSFSYLENKQSKKAYKTLLELLISSTTDENILRYEKAINNYLSNC